MLPKGGDDEQSATTLGQGKNRNQPVTVVLVGG